MRTVNALTNKECALSELINDIEKGYYVVPAFQRGSVWSPSDIAKLGDSLLWGYPVSSLLLMPRSANFDVGYDRLRLENAKISDTDGKLMYVLDGQQRLTSMGRMFIPGAFKHVFYFDLLSILGLGVDSNLIDNLPEEITDSQSLYSVIRQVVGEDAKLADMEEYACRSWPISKSIEQKEHREHYRYIRCDLVMRSKYSGAVRKFLIAHLPEDSDQLYEAFENYLGGLFGKLSSYKIPVTLISEDCDLNLVCSVFERVNASGLKLSTFDLVNAKTFGYDNYKNGLSTYLTENFKNSELSPEFDSFFGDGSDYGRYLRIVFMAEKLRQGHAPALTSSELLRKEKSYWFTAFSQEIDQLSNFVSMAHALGISHFSTKSYVEYMCAVALAHSGVLACLDFQENIVKSAVHLSLLSISLNKSSLDYVVSVSDYAKRLLKEPPLNQSNVPFPQYRSANKHLLPEDILDIPYGASGRYLSALHCMYATGLNGMGLVDIFGQPLRYGMKYSGKSAVSLHEHHLIPLKSNSGVSKDLLNSVANIVVIQANKNIQISNAKFDDYVRLIFKKSDPTNYEKLRDAFRQNFIPLHFVDSALAGIALTGDDYELLIRERADLIAAYITDYLS